MRTTSLSCRRTQPGFLVIITVCLGGALSLLLFVGARRWERDRIESDFQHHADNRVSAIQLALTERLADAEILSSVLATRDPLKFDEFRQVAARMIQTAPYIQAFDWAPRVSFDQRQSFEQAAREWPLTDSTARRAFSQFQINERTPEGRSVPAAPRKEYFPICYVEPWPGNEAAMGFDLASEKLRRETLTRALVTGKSAASPRVRLVQETNIDCGLLIAVPVFGQTSSTSGTNTVGSAKVLRGFLIDVFRVSTLVDAAFQHLQPAGLDALILDLSAPESERNLHTHWSRLRGHPVTDSAPTSWRRGLFREVSFPVVDRQWSIILQATPAFVAARNTWAPEGILASGLLLTAVLGLYLALSARRSAHLTQTNQLLLSEVSERKRAEEALRESSQFNQQIVANAQEGIMVYDRDLRYKVFNPYMEQLTGCPAAEVLGKPALELFPFLQQADLAAVWTNALAGGPPSTLELHFQVPRTGRSAWVLRTSGPFRNSRGEVTGIITLVRDISERKRVERALSESEERYRRLLEFSPDAIFTYCDSRLGFVNPAALKLFGAAAAEQLTGHPVLERIHPRFRQIASQRILSVQQHGIPVPTMELTYLRLDGSPVDVESAAAPFTIDGRFVALVIARDITERRRTEEALKKQRNDYEMIFNLVPAQIWIKDTHNRFLRVNSQVSADLGMPAQAIEGKTAEELFPDFAEKYYRDDQEVFNSGVAKLGILEQINSADGSPRWLQTDKVPYRDEHGQIAGLVAFARDFTEKQALEKQLLRAQRVESIGTLAAGIAHDLNNILAPILMSAQILQLKHPDEKEREMLATIQTSAQRGADIVKQVLTFARGVEGQRLHLQPKHLLKEIHKIAQETFPKSIILQLDVPKDLWPVIGDATQLHQVLLNLCVNARDAMPEGGTLHISAENIQVQHPRGGLFADGKPGPHVVVHITDTGHGIPPDLLERIFDPFFTTKEQGKGTGLGLSTTLGIVRSHGGFVDVFSEPGRGSTFKVYVPAQPGRPVLRPSTNPPPLPKGGGEWILVVDDESNLRSVTERTLTQHGYQVWTAANGREALGLVSQHAHQLKAIITDIMMPEMDGVALVHALKQSYPGLPIIACTGWGQEGLRAKLKGLGVEILLQKPYTAETLLKTLHQQLS